MRKTVELDLADWMTIKEALWVSENEGVITKAEELRLLTEIDRQITLLAPTPSRD